MRAAAPKRALAGWALFEWATQPFYTLILTFLFAPYFVSAVAADPARGQHIWGYAAAVAGICVGIASPLLGAVADGGSRRKPWMLAFVAVLAAGMATLWIAEPSSSAARLAIVLLAFIVATVAAESTAVFLNAIMPTLVPSDRIGRLSGIGWGIGYAGGLLSLLLIAGLVVADPATGKTLLGFDPVWKLDAGRREGDRLVGPLSAAWLAVFVIPFFLFVPDNPPVAARPSSGSPFRTLWGTIRSLPAHRDMLYFLLARAIYADGLSAIFTFGGIYGATLFDWQTGDRGLFGIILVVTGIAGALTGGFLDDRIGPKKLILGALVLLLLATAGILSVTGDRLLFVVEATPKAAGGAMLSSTGEIVFLAFAMLVGAVAAPVQSASRSLLARIAPPEQMAQFFGLFAFSGKVTAFAAPLLIALVTQVSGSQRAGLAVVALFLIAGFLLMLPVRVRAARATVPDDGAGFAPSPAVNAATGPMT